MNQPQSEYQSYLLRLWHSGRGAPWRIMLERIGGFGERQGFPDLESLMAFLQARTGETGHAIRNVKREI